MYWGLLGMMIEDKVWAPFTGSLPHLYPLLTKTPSFFWKIKKTPPAPTGYGD
jgi:hypothetical protein